MKRGLIVGKFSPLHLGHEWLIKEAEKQCDELLIISYSSPELEGCEADRRKYWLNIRFPHINSVVLNPNTTIMPLNSASDAEQQEYFADLIKDSGYRVDTLFCSETWGNACAETLTRILGHQVSATILDVDRTIVPVSGTKIREAPGKYSQYMAKEVNETFVRRIVLLGGESCGKTTLAQALATHFNTLWVPEYGRELYVQKNGVLTEQDLTHIAYTQIRREKNILLFADRYLFCDTSPLTTSGYSQWMFGRINSKLAEFAQRRYHGVIMCTSDIPFVQDGTRIDHAFRMQQHDWYQERISSLDCPVLEVSGSVNQRISLVTQWLDKV